MSAVIFFVISAGIFLGSSVSKEYKCYQQLEGGTARRNFSCQTSNALDQTTTPPYSQTTPSSYPGCPRNLTCTESSFTSVGTTTGSPTTTTTTSDTTWTPTKSMTFTTASTTEVTGTTSISRSTGSNISTTSITTSATVTSSSSESSTSFFMTTPATTPTTPASLTAILMTEALTTTKSPTTPVVTTPVSTTPVPTTSVPTTPVPTTSVPTTPIVTTPDPTTPVPTTPVPTTPVSTTPVSTTPVPTTPIVTTSESSAPVPATDSTSQPMFAPLLAAIDPTDQEASVYSCFSFDTFIARLGTENIWCQEILEDHCTSNPCRNGATCFSEPYRYRCVCAPGFTDPECMTQINLCENYPCEPFGTCEDFLNDYNCTCKAGFKFVNRTYCEDIDECQLINTTSTSTALTDYTPCSNGSQCKNYPGGYECLCPKGKLGKYCELDDTNKLQTVTDIRPTFGLLAGGGLLNITGTNLNLYPHLGAYFKPENQSLEELYGFAEENVTKGLTLIRIPRAPSTGYIGQHMNITIKYSNEKNLSVPQKFVYTDNPSIISISPSIIPIRVGVKLKIKGHNLDSVIDPVLKTRVVMMDEVTASDHHAKCSAINETDMECQLPSIPQVLPNTASTSRSKRNVVPDDAKFNHINPKSIIRELSNWTDDWLEDKSSGLSANSNWNSIRFKRDDGNGNTTKNLSQIPYIIYMGLYFDNFPKYTNLTRSYPRYQPKLSLSKPAFNVISKYSPQEFDPSLKESFKIEGESMTDGLTLEDYNVGVGTGTCQPYYLEAKQLECLPPKFKPEPGLLADKYGCGGNLPVTVEVGSLDPQFYACMKYVQSNKRAPLIIGLSVGLTGFLILVLITAWLVCCLIRRKGRLQTDDGEADESTTWNNELRPSYRRVVADADLEPEVRDFAGGYSTNLNNDRRVSQEQNPSDIVSVSQRNRGQAKDYFFYGENNPDVALVKKQSYGDFLKAKDRISYTRPNRQFDDIEENKSKPKDYKQVYHNMSFNKQTILDD